MDGIKKKLQNLKIQVDEAEDRAQEAEKEKKALEEERDSVNYYSKHVYQEMIVHCLIFFS